MIVLDASAAVEVLLDTDLGRRIEDHVWGDDDQTPNAPHLLDVEVSQVLGRLVRAKKVGADHARAMIDDLCDFDLVRHSHVVLLERVFELRTNLTAYDAVYVALAEALDASLVSCDAKLARAPGSRARIVLLR